MPGSFLVGFLLSPILYLSRYISQKPLHRLRFPEEKKRHRRFLALGFYLGTFLIVGGVVGFWSKWQLDWRDPWVFIVYWVLEGRYWWSRPSLLAYWGALASISVAGWELQLAKTRQKRPWASVGPPGRDVVTTTNSGGSRPPSAAGTAANQGTRTQTFGGRDVGTAHRHQTVIDRVPVISLNGRRKFFHGLAILMFVPGIYFDVSFSPFLLFSFSCCTLASTDISPWFRTSAAGLLAHRLLRRLRNLRLRRIRSVLCTVSVRRHGPPLFERVHRPQGFRHGHPQPLLPVNGMCARGLAGKVRLLSPVDLRQGLTRSLACSPSPLLSYVGVLTLGVGDALVRLLAFWVWVLVLTDSQLPLSLQASIVGRRYGRRLWSTSSGKTVEGSVAFVVSVVAAVEVASLVGIVPPVSVRRSFLVSPAQTP